MGPIREDRWRVLRDRVKERWGALTDDELDQVPDRIDQLAELIEKRYGEARERAGAEIRSLMIEEAASAGSNRGRRRRDRARGGGRAIDAARPPTSG